MDRIRTRLGSARRIWTNLLRLGPLPPLLVGVAILGVVTFKLAHRSQPVLAPTVRVHHRTRHTRPVHSARPVASSTRAPADLAARLPLVGPVRTGYGWMFDRSLGAWRFHSGWDIAGVKGQAVVAAVAGTVTGVGPGPDSLSEVTVDSGQGRQERYAHLQGVKVSLGQRVDPGTLVGVVGATGSGPAYLHFEVLANGAPVSPALVVPISNRGS